MSDPSRFSGASPFGWVRAWLAGWREVIRWRQDFEDMRDEDRA